MVPHWEGRFQDALEIHRRYIVPEDIATAVDTDKIWLYSLSLGGIGEYQKALDHLIHLHTVSKRLQDDIIGSRILNTLGWVYSELQDHQQALEWNTRGIKAAQKVGFPNPEVESNARINLGDNLVALGRLDEAEEQYQHVEKTIRNPRPQDLFALWRYSQRLFHSYGELWLARELPDKALSYASECLALAEENNSQKNIVKEAHCAQEGMALHCKIYLTPIREISRNPAILLKICQSLSNRLMK